MGRLRNELGRVCLIATPIVLIACSADRYAGVDLRPGSAPVDVQQLAREAGTGDKQAQLALGIRYENGDGVSVDLRRARRLYERAARDTGGVFYVYMPSPGNNSPAHVSPVRSPVIKGLDAARSRLAQLDAR